MASPADNKQEAGQRRDALLLKLLKTPPQPRPKRERTKTNKPHELKGSKAGQKSEDGGKRQK